MAKDHGLLRHYQVLLGPHRAALLEKLAEERGVRGTALARELIYAGLQRSTVSWLYAAEEAKDEAVRREGIARQVRGRIKPRTEPELDTP